MARAHIEGHIYFIASSEPMSLKVGFTTKDPRKRLAQLQTGNPVKLDLLGWYPGDMDEEKALHIALAEYRLAGEWFQLDPAMNDILRQPFACMRVNNILTGYGAGYGGHQG